jgi:hypothetical protein
MVMSFKAVWGFDPEEVMKAQQTSRENREEPVAEDELDGLTVTPYGDDAQIYELRRMFRLYGAELFA